MKSYSYISEVKMYDNEIPAKIRLDTGEVTPYEKRRNNIPNGKEVFEPQAFFSKNYTKSWKFLSDKLTPLEFKVAYILALKAKANTNSLEPLNDDSTIPELVESLGISKNKVKPTLDKLFRLGVYAKFEVYDKTKPYTKYWILNPYLSFSGKLINSDITRLFNGTEIALNFRKSE